MGRGARVTEESRKGVHLGIRVEQAIIDALDAEANEIQESHPGVKVQRSAIARAWLLEAMERRASRKKK